MRKLTTLLLCAALAVSLSACGRKSRPAAPEGSMYPRVYPPVPIPRPDDEDQGQDQNQTNPKGANAQGKETKSQ